MTLSKHVSWDLPRLLRHLPGMQAFQRPLAAYTSLRIGGPADALVHIDSPATMCRVQEIARTHEVPLFVLGGGSNLLVRDGGIRGIVLIMRGALRTYHLRPCPQAPSAATVTVGAGYTLSRLALQVARDGWSGLEFAYGIPGTVGGAMIMNAGTNLGDLRQVLISARMLLNNGQIQELPVSALGLRYRGSAYPPGAVLLDATLRLQQADAASITTTMQTAYRHRQRTQPLTLPNAGSIFKNPPGVAAGHLIDNLGLKGLRRGGAQISMLHANFIVNVDHATAADVIELMQYIQERVERTYAIALEPEVRIVGEEC